MALRKGRVFFGWILLSQFLVACGILIPADDSKDPSSDGSSLKLTLLAKSVYQSFGVDYPLSFYRVSESGQNSYFYYVKTCESNCPVVLFSNPYDGVDWTGETVDQTWAVKPGASSGFRAVDTEATSFPGVQDGHLFYLLSPPSTIANQGAFLSPNQISYIIIFHRFYAGRSVQAYVDDFVRVSKVLNQFAELDRNKVGYWGASLGGFIAGHAAISSPVKPKLTVLVTPLSGWKEQLEYIESLPLKINSNSSQLAEAQSFFAPYQKRLYQDTGGSFASVPQNFSKLTSAYLGQNLPSQTLLFHDSWDTLVPIGQSEALVQSNALVEPVWFTHSTGIDYNNFNLDHSQPSEGLKITNISPFYFMTFIRSLRPELPVKTLYYDFNQFAAAMAAFHDAQTRGESISWLTLRMKDFCSEDVSMVDYTNTIGTVTGKYLIHTLIHNIWGQNLPYATFCNGPFF